MLKNNMLMQDVEQLMKALIIKGHMLHFGVNLDSNSFIGLMKINQFLKLVAHYLSIRSLSNGIIIYMWILPMEINAIIHIFITWILLLIRSESFNLLFIYRLFVEIGLALLLNLIAQEKDLVKILLLVNNFKNSLRKIILSGLLIKLEFMDLLLKTVQYIQLPIA